MAKPPDFRRVLRDDIPDAPNWVDPIIGAYNIFMEQSYSLFNKNLSIGDNVTGKIVSITFTTPSDYLTGGFNNLRFSWEFSKVVDTITIGKIEKYSGGTILSPVTVTSWSQPNSSTVTVSYIAGLAASTKYTVKLLVM